MSWFTLFAMFCEFLETASKLTAIGNITWSISTFSMQRSLYAQFRKECYSQPRPWCRVPWNGDQQKFGTSCGDHVHIVFVLWSQPQLHKWVSSRICRAQFHLDLSSTSLQGLQFAQWLFLGTRSDLRSSAFGRFHEFLEMWSPDEVYMPRIRRRGKKNQSVNVITCGLGHCGDILHRIYLNWWHSPKEAGPMLRTNQLPRKRITARSVRDTF